MSTSNEEIKKDILKRLAKEYVDNEIPAVFTGKNNEIPADVVTVELDGYGFDADTVIGEFFYTPETESLNITYFNSVITVADDIPEENAAVVAAAAAVLNFHLVTGGYAIDKSGTTLVYKNSVPTRLEDDSEKMYANAELWSIQAVDISERYSGMLLKLAYGQVTFDEFMDMIPE